MLFDKSPGKEKFILLKCMLNAKLWVPAGEYLNPPDKQKKSQYGLWDGDALLSHRVAPAVPSARVGLTSGFGMGPGVPPQQESPAHEQDSKRISLSSVLLVRWRRPTLPQGCPCSTIGACGLNFRVRYGTGCTPTARIASSREVLKKFVRRSARGCRCAGSYNARVLRRAQEAISFIALSSHLIHI